MPKQVDYASRRRQIAEAVCLLVDEHGPEGVTMRDVAARAQVSLGAVQRCFRSKDEMLLFAVGHVGERITERVRDRLAHSDAESAATTLSHVAIEIALLREEHRAEARIWLVFVAQAAVSEPLAGPLRTSYAALQDLLARLVAEVVESVPVGEGAAPPDPQREARTLLALADGLTSHVLIGHLTAEEAAEVLHAQVVGLRRATRP
ncbi:TetR family transcriptional regulator C-terminal domain-containing protein [Micromonospora sp. WMMD1128]|uniref:TetR/AcrR family transcriptional regulator n=1 Tax=Micromonospora sp. WMMD1128 TaxID=3015150 RepID=UPI00248B0890|nr:TetR family transcriptional regulator C-terminal domain-containing protein [Micromonospora sp. WMMD1128]WBB73389.1 TetR family transcriptional regulator C-terminal domain-containing protein [Micromonospora sp. WMMD1128]